MHLPSWPLRNRARFTFCHKPRSVLLPFLFAQTRRSPWKREGTSTVSWVFTLLLSDRVGFARVSPRGFSAERRMGQLVMNLLSLRFALISGVSFHWV